MKHKKDVQSVDIPTKFKCEICQQESISTSALKYHISLKHDSTFQLKWRLNLICFGICIDIFIYFEILNFFGFCFVLLNTKMLPQHHNKCIKTRFFSYPKGKKDYVG